MMALRDKYRIFVLLMMSSIVISVLAMSLFSASKSSFFLQLNLVNVSAVSAPFGFIFDPISLSFSALVLSISACVFMFSRWYMNSDVYYWRFTWVLLLFVVSMNILIFSGSMVTLMLGWDGLGISSFALIIYYESKSSLSAGFLTLIVNRIGDVLIMSSLVYLVMEGHMLLIINGTNMGSFFIIMMVAAITKSAQYPFSPWLPAAMAAPTPVSALVHSSTLVTAGIYLLIRLNMSSEFPSYVQEFLLFVGCITSLIGGVCAFQENDLKKIIAFSTLSQLGLMVFSLGLGTQLLALFHLYMHALFKALLFLAGGYILMQSYGAQDIRVLGGTLKHQPLGLIFFNISCLCLMGFPFLSAYYSKHAILSAMLTGNVNFFSFVVFSFALVLSGAYMVRLLLLLNWSRFGSGRSKDCMFGKNLNFWFPMMLLYLGSVLVGSFFKSIFPFMQSCHFYSTFYDYVLYLIMLMGVIFGVIKGFASSIFVNSMFYTANMWQKMTIVSYNLSVASKDCEANWFEPSSYLGKEYTSKWKMWGLVGWSESSFGYMQQMLVFISLLMLAWFF